MIPPLHHKINQVVILLGLLILSISAPIAVQAASHSDARQAFVQTHKIIKSGADIHRDVNRACAISVATPLDQVVNLAVFMQTLDEDRERSPYGRADRGGTP